jgi:ring-1,2-phenylacetyl-CoA epoxidase subunit PaaD
MVKTRAPIDRDEVLEVLAGVADPEIPAVSVLDLGIVERVEVEGTRAKVTCLPTFVGCPALEAIREDIEKALYAIGADPEVEFVFHPPWTSDRITEEGRRKLGEYGLAPPSGSMPDGPIKLTLLAPGRCPYCGSRDTVLESPFGPTACRATCYCRACRNPFEQFKPV